MLDKITKPRISYCQNCVYPSSAAVQLEFDEKGICSGCLTSLEKKIIDWDKRKKLLVETIKDIIPNNDNYDCIIPVSGGKDSYFQTHIVMNELNLKPLLVTYNANNYSDTGLKNLLNMKEKFNVDHIFFTPSIGILKKLNRLGMIVLGDMNWHCHAGIMTYPIKVAVEKNIPLMFWGEHGRADVSGMFSYNDFIEFTYRIRHEHDCRGYEWNDLIKIGKKYNEIITSKDLIPWQYPNDDEISNIGLRGLYISNFFKWEANNHIEMVKKDYNFIESDEGFERTYRNMSNLDDIHENGIHDYMKFIKFGYGRASDHVSKDIRAGLISRTDGIKEVKNRDHIKSKDIYRWLQYVGWSMEKFDYIADGFRDPRVWWIKNDKWYKNDVDGSISSYGKVNLKENERIKYYKEN